MKTISLVGTTGACLLLGVIVWRQQESLREARAEAALAFVARDAAKLQADEMGLRLVSAEKGRTQAEEELKNLREVRETTAKPPVAKGREGDMAGLAVLNTPGMQKMMATMARGGLDQRYGPLFRKLKLSPADLVKFKDQLVEKQMSGLDVIQAVHTQGGDASADEKGMAAVLGSVQGELDANIHALLGDEGFKRYEDFNQNADAYGLLDQLERRLGYTNASLQPAQSDLLLGVLAETTERPATAGGAKGPMAGVLQSMAGGNPMLAAMTEPRITEKTLTEAEKVLTPSQVEVLRQIQTEQQERADSLQAVRDMHSPGAKKL